MNSTCDQFIESGQVLDILRKEVTRNDKYYGDLQSIIPIFSRYQEKPNLLDSSLKNILEEINKILVHVVEDNSSDDKLKECAFDIVYTLCKVRGWKQVSRFLTREVCYLENTIVLLHKYCEVQCCYRELCSSGCSQEDVETFVSPWKSIYSLLAMTHNLLLVPFDLSTIDSKGTMLTNLIEVCLKSFTDSSPAREIACYVLGRLFSRTDVFDKKSETLSQVIALMIKYIPMNGIITNVQEKVDGISLTFDSISFGLFRRGLLISFASLLKFADRKKLLGFYHLFGYDEIIKFLVKLSEITTSAGERRLASKITQRVCLSLVKPQPKLRQFGSRLGHKINDMNVSESMADEDFDIQDIEGLEILVETLLFYLQDRDTIVRWSAAKGIARIFNRLAVGEVRNLLIDSLLLNRNCQGSMLAVAETTRRGLLDFEKLSEEQVSRIRIYVESCLLFEEQRGKSSVGANVRDAACYFIWSFSRANSPRILLKHEKYFVYRMVVASLFDCDLNCRRCACAALQEYIGRLGNQLSSKGEGFSIADRIFLIKTLNFFSVNLEAECYSNLSIAISKELGPDITRFMLRYLVQEKIYHWKPKVRELSSACIARLQETLQDDSGIVLMEKAIEDSLTRNNRGNNSTRHGGVLLMKCLVRTSKHFSPSVAAGIRNVVMKLEKDRCYRGKNGDLIRIAVLQLISVMCDVDNNALNLSKKTVLRLLGTCKEGLYHNLLRVQKEAYNTIKFIIKWLQRAKYLDTYEIDEVAKNMLEWQSNLHADALSHSNVAFRRGAVMGLASFISGSNSTLSFNQIDLLKIFETIGYCCFHTNKRYWVCSDFLEFEYLQKLLYSRGNEGLNELGRKYVIFEGPEEANDARLREVSIHSLFEVGNRLLANTDICINIKVRISNILIALASMALQDYDSDERGDVGSWVRKETIENTMLMDSNKVYLHVHDNILAELLKCLIQHVFERNQSLSRISIHALSVILPETTLNVVATDRMSLLKAGVKSVALEEGIFIGLISSLSDLTISVQHQALKDFQDGRNVGLFLLPKITPWLLDYGKRSIQSELKLNNWLTALEKLWDEYNFQDIPNFSIFQRDLLEILDVAMKERSFRVIASVSKLVLKIWPVCNQANRFQRLTLNILSHKYTRIRSNFANSLYLEIMKDEDIISWLGNESYSQFCDLLVTIPWEDKDSLKHVKSIADIFGIKKKTQVKNHSNTMINDENIRENGYKIYITELNKT